VTFSKDSVAALVKTLKERFKGKKLFAARHLGPLQQLYKQRLVQLEKERGGAPRRIYWEGHVGRVIVGNDRANWTPLVLREEELHGLAARAAAKNLL
jgi:hypothetical protein